MAFKIHRPGAIQRFTFDTIDLGAGGAPWIDVRYGGKGTPGFRSDEIRLANQRRNRGDKLTEHGVDETLVEDAKLIAKHCCTAWGNFVESDGSSPPCTAAKAEEFLRALIADREDLFLDFRAFVRDAENFIDAPAPSGAELGKP